MTKQILAFVAHKPRVVVSQGGLGGRCMRYGWVKGWI